MSEQAVERKDPKATKEFWKAEPHNCTDKEAQAQIDKHLSGQEEQNQ